MNTFCRWQSAADIKREDAKREASLRYSGAGATLDTMPQLLAQSLPTSLGGGLPDKVRASVEAARPASAKTPRSKGRACTSIGRRATWQGDGVKGEVAAPSAVIADGSSGDQELPASSKAYSIELLQWKQRALKAEERLKFTKADLERSKQNATALRRQMAANGAELAMLRSNGAVPRALSTAPSRESHAPPPSTVRAAAADVSVDATKSAAEAGALERAEAEAAWAQARVSELEAELREAKEDARLADAVHASIVRTIKELKHGDSGGNSANGGNGDNGDNGVGDNSQY